MLAIADQPNPICSGGRGQRKEFLSEGEATHQVKFNLRCVKYK